VSEPSTADDGTDRDEHWTDLGETMRRLGDSMTELSESADGLDGAFASLEDAINRLRDRQDTTAEALAERAATAGPAPTADGAETTVGDDAAGD